MSIQTTEVANASVILDCGAYRLRAGYAGERGPRLDIPALVGHPRNRGVAMAAGMNELEVGEEAFVKRGMLTVNSPIRDGLVTNWDDMEKLWSHIMFRELRVTPESHCFIVTQSVNAPAPQKEKTLELMMETFHAHSVFLGTSQVMSLYSYGLTTGLVLDSGRDRTLAVPIHEGYELGRHVTQSPVAGDVLTQYLGNLLREEGYSFGTAAEMTVLNQAKEDLCYVRPSRFSKVAHSDQSFVTDGGVLSADTRYSRSADQVSDSINAECFSLPDGQSIPLTTHRHQTTEVLFNFSLLNDARYVPDWKVLTEMGENFTPSFDKGISWLPFAAINNCQPSLRPQLYANIVLAGSNMSFPGTRHRIESEVVQLYRETHTSEAVTPIHVKDVACRAHSAWIGCSVLARMSMFPHLTVSRKEYEEEGLRVVHCKCL